uniref:Enoyl-CoA hydratase/isomerase n=1 Tax=Rathayibacter sp. FH 236 TaxID=2615183 RepID=A0A5J6SGB4_9MICO|nr:enoyl-CoA hydratase/isomerase [Rathayibacter sp. FH 236]
MGNGHFESIDLSFYPSPFGTAPVAVIDLSGGSHRGSGTPLTQNRLDEIQRALQEIDGSAALVLTGTGGSFSVGADLDRLSSGPGTEIQLTLRSGHKAFSAVRSMRIPTFAFLNGIALGGGLELALHCRYRVVADNVRALGFPEFSRGLLAAWGGTYLLPQLVGVQNAFHLLVERSAIPLEPEEALAFGIVDRLLPTPFFRGRAMEWAFAILQGEETVDRTAGTSCVHTLIAEEGDPLILTTIRLINDVVSYGYDEAIERAGAALQSLIAETRKTARAML